MSDRVVRHARVSWLTHPPGGTARIGVESRAFGAMPVSLPEGDPVPHEATPGELLAIAHGMFMAVALAEGLRLAGSPADEIVVEAACTFAGPISDRELISVDLRIVARVPEMDRARFEQAVHEAHTRALRAAATKDDLPGRIAVELDGAR